MTTALRPPKPTRGIDLKISRIRAGLRQQDLADLMGCSRQRVTQIELLGTVKPEWAKRYKDALAEARKPAG